MSVCPRRAVTAAARSVSAVCVLQLFGLYKRAGQRVIVNRRGDLIVRPNHFELSMLQNVRGGSTAHHMTVAYQNALVAIVTAQLKASSRHGDGLHGLLGLLREMPQVQRLTPLYGIVQLHVLCLMPQVQRLTPFRRSQLDHASAAEPWQFHEGACTLSM